MSRYFTRRRLLAALALFAIFTAIATLFFEYRYLDDLARGVRGTFWPRLIEETTGAYSVFVLFPFIVWIVRRFPVRRGTWQVAIPALIAGALVFSAAHTTLMAVSRNIVFPLAGLGAYDYGIMLYRYPMEASNDLVWFAIIAAIITYQDRMARARRAELDAAALQAKLAEAQLENLRLQLNPHFLFNTLNAISSVMYEDVHRADEMLAKLSDFLRTVLASSAVQQVSVDEELDVERMYVDIMTSRLERAMTLDVHVDDGAGRARVPFMILQPLLENSIKHGQPPERTSLAIGIDVARRGDTTVISVIDNGAGFDGTHRPQNGNASSGHGLYNVRARLRYLYGDAASFHMESGSQGGTHAILTLPYETGGNARA
jgi:LytS/YehU family sensor histidine kinase